MKKSRSLCDGFGLAAAFLSCAARRYQRVNLSVARAEVPLRERGALAAMEAVSSPARAKRAFVKTSASASNSAKCSFQSARRSRHQILQGNFDRCLRSFHDPRRTRAHFSRSGLVNQLIASIRRRMMASAHRASLNVHLFARNDGADGRFSPASR
jgi:hypothetical protein